MAFHVPAHKNVAAPAAQFNLYDTYLAYRSKQFARAANRERVFLLGFDEFVRAFNEPIFLKAA